MSTPNAALAIRWVLIVAYVWAALHPRLEGIVCTGTTVPRYRRAAKNSTCFLATRSGIEPAGWGDLSLQNLELIARRLDPDDIFLPVRERAGIHLNAPTPGTCFDWAAAPHPLPPHDVFAASVTFIARHHRVLRVSATPEIVNGDAELTAESLTRALGDLCGPLG